MFHCYLVPHYGQLHSISQTAQFPSINREHHSSNNQILGQQNIATIIVSNCRSIIKVDGCPETTCSAHVNLTMSLPEQMFQNGTCTHDGEQLCKFIWKFKQNSSSHGLDQNFNLHV